MGAQFSDIELPETHLQYCQFAVDSGEYICNIVQVFDPSLEKSEQDDLDFIITLNKTIQPTSPWADIPWYDC